MGVSGNDLQRPVVVGACGQIIFRPQQIRIKLIYSSGAISIMY